MFLSRLRYAAAALLGLALLGAAPVYAQDFRGDGWSHTYRANCGMPVARANDSRGRPVSIQWQSVNRDTSLVFRLNPGDTGGCSNDGGAFNGAAFWERAEVRQDTTLSQGLNYRITFDATFIEGFEGIDEHFFQIAGWASSCRSSPLLKLQFDRGRLEAKVLKPDATSTSPVGGRVTDVRLTGFGLNIRRLRGQTNQFQVDLDLRGPNQTIEVSLNGRTILREQTVHVASCSQPYVKVGLFRPGGQNRQRTTFAADDLVIGRLR